MPRRYVNTSCRILLPRPPKQDEATLERCVAEANVYALAAHQYWGVWSFLQVAARGGLPACMAAWPGLA